MISYYQLWFSDKIRHYNNISIHSEFGHIVIDIPDHKKGHDSTLLLTIDEAQEMIKKLQEIIKEESNE